MKKNYIAPNSKVIIIESRSAVLTVSYSTEQAHSDATVFSRQGGAFDDDEVE